MTTESDNPTPEAEDDDGTRMPLREHLEELRGCVARAAGVLFALFLAGMIFDEPFVAFMNGPWEAVRESMVAAGDPDPGKLSFIKPTEGFLFSMKVALSFALLVGGPYLLFEVWRFVGIGLHDHERKAVLRSLPFAVLLFALGLGFGFYVAVPIAMPVLLTWVSVDLAQPVITLQEYLSLLLTLSLLLGFVFELPIIMWLVVRAGLIEVKTFSDNRRVALLVMLVFAAIMTPPDVITQLLVVLPMAVLFEIGLLLGRRAQTARDRSVL